MGLIERDFKLKFMARLCLFVVVGMLGVTLLLYYLTFREFGGSYEQTFSVISGLKRELFPLIFASFYSIFILGIVTVAIALISMFHSHKMAGPIYRIERNLETIGSGDLTIRTRFRSYDQLTELADELNRMTSHLNHLVQSIKEKTFHLALLEKKLKQTTEKGMPPTTELKRLSEEITKGARELRRLTDEVRIREV